MNQTTIDIEAEVIPPTTQLDLAVQSAGVIGQASDQLKGKFGGYFERAGELVNAARAVHVSDATQLTEMAQARKLRLDLAKVRIEAEKTRKEMKEASLREGRAIDGINNVLKGLIEPVEDKLQEMEDFAKIAEAKRKEAIREERTTILAGLGQDVVGFDLATMEAATFDNLVAGIRAANEARIAAEKKAEEDRIAREKAEAEERERQRIENARLKAEAEKREAEIKAERARVEKEREAERVKAEAERKRLADIAKAEAEKREAIERAERERKADEERKAAAEEAARKAAAKAPDAQKLKDFAQYITSDLLIPDCKTREGKACSEWLQRQIGLLADKLTEKANAL